MSVEIASVLKVEAKPLISHEYHWAKRKEAYRARRSYASEQEKRHHVSRRQAETAAPREQTERPPAPGTRPPPPAPPSRISVGEIEWSGATGAPAQVVLRLHPAGPAPHPRGNLSSTLTGGSGVVVRAEEALIVAFVLLLWIAAIALFFNRWGKIRMLEPYQPKFQQQHRQSCALAETAVSVPPHSRKMSMQHRASLSRGCVSYDCGSSLAAYQPCGYMGHRLRQNSVFVGSAGGMALIPESPPRRSRSAADLPALSAPADRAPRRSPRASRAASLHSAVDLRAAPSPRASHSAVDMSAVQVHLHRPKSPKKFVTNV